MKLLRSGPAWQKEIECTRCSSLLLVDEQDLYSEIINHTDGSESRRYWFKCPQCSSENNVQHPCISEHALAKAEARAQAQGSQT